MSERNLFFVFPGQGSQYVGMGSDLVEEFETARALFDRASEIVGYDMGELCFADPRAELGLTRFTQPALLTHELACLRVFQSLVGPEIRPTLAAGHSLGEYSALVAAEALSFDDALALVQHRGQLMSELGSGGMLATTLERDAAAALADKHFCAIAGCNSADQTVVSGRDADLDALVAEMERDYPSRRAIRLNTEGAFHSYLMITAAQRFREMLERTEFGPPKVEVLSNYTGRPHDSTADALRSRLFLQLFNPVRWVECMDAAIDAGIDAVVEFGGGVGKGDGPEAKRPNLEGIVKKNLRRRGYEARYLPAVNAAGIRGAAKQLLGG